MVASSGETLVEFGTGANRKGVRVEFAPVAAGTWFLRIRPRSPTDGSSSS